MPLSRARAPPRQRPCHRPSSPRSARAQGTGRDTEGKGAAAAQTAAATARRAGARRRPRLRRRRSRGQGCGAGSEHGSDAEGTPRPALWAGGAAALTSVRCHAATALRAGSAGPAPPRHRSAW